jgi:hypothetical protein
MKKLMRFRGLMVIVLWQATPIGTDEYGRTRLGFGLGGGQLEYVDLGCNGEVLEHDVAKYRSAGASADHWVVPGRVRVQAAAGYQWADSVTSEGPFGGLLLAYERQRFGVGGGFAIMPASLWYFGQPFADQTRGRVKSDYDIMPTLYIRAGNRDQLHTRLDVFPGGVTSPSEMVRIGVGYNQFDNSRPSLYFGLGAVAASLEEPGSNGLVGEYMHPVTRNVAVGVHGFASPGKRSPQAGLTTMMRIDLR